MKSKTLWFFLAGLVLLASACRHHRRNRMVMNNGDYRVEIRYDGEIRFNDDETAIARISSGGYLEYWHNDDHLLAGTNDSGVMRVELYENGKAVDTASAEGKALVSRVIRGMIDMGFDIEGRMDRIYQKGGNVALLRETDSVKDDYTRGRYLSRILEGDSLSTALVSQVIAKAGSRSGSDYEKDQLLEKVGLSYLKNDSVSAEYLMVVKGMAGDYEKSQALQHFLRGNVTLRQYVPVLEATESLDGNYERSNVLRGLIDQPLAEGQPFDSLLNVVGRMDGDYEKGNLLKQIVHKDVREGNSWAGLIRTTRTLGGEYERSNVLIEIGQKLPKTDSLRVLYMNAAKTVHSDVDYGRVVKAVEQPLAEKSKKDEN